MANRERFKEIIRVLASYGFGHIYHTKIRTQKRDLDPQNLRLAFEELGPSFIKIGQIISTRRDVLPPAYIEELAKLQDSAPPFSFEEVRRIIKEDMRTDLENIFESVEEKPIASASVAQVHHAKLKTGEEVVLKIRRPGIEQSLLEDIELFIKVFSKTKGLLKDTFVDPIKVIQEIRETTKIELDFRNEVNYLLRFKELNEDIACVDVPKPYLNLCSKRIIVQEYIKGSKVTDTGELAEAGYDLEDIGRKLLLAYLSQVFKDGFFHGDPHPGNLIIKDARIYFIDFGIMGELTNETKQVLNDILKALALKDIDRLMNLLIQIAVSNGPVKKDRLYEDLSYLFDTYFSTSLQNVRITALITDVFEITRRHDLLMPSDLTNLVRSMTILEGITTTISPSVNLIQIATNYLTESNDFSFYDKLSSETLLLRSYQFARDTIKIPSQLSSLLESLTNGRVKIKLDLLNMDEKWIGLNKMVNRIVFALIVSALIIASAFIILASSGRGLSAFGVVSFVSAGVLGFWLLISIIRSGNL